MELADVTDSKSVGSDTVSVRPRLPAPKNSASFSLSNFFIQAAGDKPSAWYIIDARSAAYIIKGGKPPLYIITRQRASYLRLDDMQCFALMIYNSFGIDDIQHFVLMICNSFGIDDIHAFGVIGTRIVLNLLQPAPKYAIIILERRWRYEKAIIRSNAV